MTRDDAINLLITSTISMAQDGKPLMRRILPEGEIALWDHYPEYDRVSPVSGARYFYHCHPVEERGAGEHGHFHLFLARTAMPKGAKYRLAPPRHARKGVPAVVHIAALSIDTAGLPIGLFTVNQWVTNEWLYPASAINDAITAFDLRDADGDPLVNQWLTALVQLARPNISALLDERDAVLAANNWDGRDEALEILSSRQIDIDALIA
jgi:hypothetical protein